MRSAAQEPLGIALSPSHPPHRLMLRSPAGFTWDRVTLPIRDLPPALEGLRIAHLSDIHATTRWFDAYDRLHEELHTRKPDLLLVTGDFKDRKTDYAASLPIVEKIVRGLEARIGVWGILGNHDGDLLGPFLTGVGFTLLDHRRLVLGSPDAQIELLGLAGVARSDLDPDWMRTLPPRTPGVPRIALCHYPDSIRASLFLDPDLWLCGHTHGGQLCLPSGRPLLTHDTLPPWLCRGIHKVDDTWLVVNRGFGYSGLAIRLNCPSQVIEITLVKAGT